MEHKPNLQYFRVCGSPADARPYRPNEKKLDEKAISFYFIGYAERSRGISFIILLIELYSR
jgi:hypothetical protein